MQIKPQFASVFMVDARHLGTKEAKALKDEIAKNYPPDENTARSFSYPVMDRETQGLRDNMERLHIANIEDKHDDHFEQVVAKHGAKSLKVAPYNIRWTNFLDPLMDLVMKFAKNHDFADLRPLANALSKTADFLKNQG